MSGKLIFGLDIGSSKIISMVGTLGDKVNIIGLSSYHFVNNPRNNDLTMISNGLICEVERAGTRIAQTLHEAQISADCSAGSVIVNLAGNHCVISIHIVIKEMGSHPVTEDIIRYIWLMKQSKL